ncbi:MAG: iron-sulfur cluster assembly accessory protein [Candidatus Pelagibacter sp. TMED153]|nr:MAG: iron-sulfur cluster assembly accessory protein [Candidatus Pelagibacter sp. TMED153]|tara:strand:+ start:1574 stop:1891 length:318 start_codon:yes stop_codon:yes gene_type:complete
MTKKIEFTDRARKQIEKIISEDQLKKFFRISVKGGGCSGFKYNFSFDDKINNEDVLFGKAVIDNTSLGIISGSTIDFKKEMIGESFVINNPKASSSCGCGLSFSV